MNDYVFVSLKRESDINLGGIKITCDGKYWIIPKDIYEGYKNDNLPIYVFTFDKTSNNLMLLFLQKLY